MRKRKFSGELLKRIHIPQRRYLADALSGGDGSDIEKEIWLKKLQKLFLLFEHYNIKRDSDCWILLSWCLANEFVPGFKLGGKRGAKPQKKVPQQKYARGRPPKYENLEEWPEQIDALKQKNNLKTDKEALEFLFAEYAKGKNMSITVTLDKHKSTVKTLSNIISKARNNPKK